MQRTKRGNVARQLMRRRREGHFRHLSPATTAENCNLPPHSLFKETVSPLPPPTRLTSAGTHGAGHHIHHPAARARVAKGPGGLQACEARNGNTCGRKLFKLSQMRRRQAGGLWPSAALAKWQNPAAQSSCSACCTVLQCAQHATSRKTHVTPFETITQMQLSFFDVHPWMARFMHLHEALFLPQDLGSAPLARSVEQLLARYPWFAGTHLAHAVVCWQACCGAKC